VYVLGALTIAWWRNFRHVLRTGQSPGPFKTGEQWVDWDKWDAPDSHVGHPYLAPTWSIWPQNIHCCWFINHPLGALPSPPATRSVRWASDSMNCWLWISRPVWALGPQQFETFVDARVKAWRRWCDGPLGTWIQFHRNVNTR
jgi:hypothetical protein